ncbi:MAG: hypothetical protein M1836_002746 [Candelina mexicana]|nr:MAG: hypothetical protein M1836_002746 [Candelina mexicana]
MDEPDHSTWYDINAAVRFMLNECLATGKLGIGGYALEYGSNKNIGIFVFQTQDLPTKEPVPDPVAEAVQKCGWTAAETAMLFQSVSSCAAVQPPAQCNTGSASGRSVGHCMSSDSCCEGYRCVFAKYTNVAIAFGAATIGGIGSCLPN